MPRDDPGASSCAFLTVRVQSTNCWRRPLVSRAGETYGQVVNNRAPAQDRPLAGANRRATGRRVLGDGLSPRRCPGDHETRGIAHTLVPASPGCGPDANALPTVEWQGSRRQVRGCPYTLRVAFLRGPAIRRCP